MAKVKEEEKAPEATPRKRNRKSAKRRWRKKMAVERERLARKEKKRQDFEWMAKEKESRKSGNTVTIGTDLLKRITFPSESEDEEVRTDKPKKMKKTKNLSKKRKNPDMTSEHREENKLKSSKKKLKERKQTENCDQPIKKKKKRDEEGQKSLEGDSPVVNTGGPTGNQSQNAPFQQAPAFNGSGGGGGMNVGAAGICGGQGGGYGGGGQGQFGGGGGGGPQFGNGNPMESFSFQGNRQFNEQSVSEVMQAMQVVLGIGVAAMAQMRTGQESQMTANHGSAGFRDGYGGDVQSGGQGDQSSWRQ